jgi:arylsulfatase A
LTIGGHWGDHSVELVIARKFAVPLLAAAAAVSSAVAQSVPALRPNVVLFLADDLGYGDLGAHGNPHVRTPQLDRFAKDGVEFTHFYVNPICHPTRAALMTGRHAQRTFRGVSFHMDPAEVTIAEILRGAGYRTGLFGKWHLGDGPEECPNAQGFDEAVTFPKGQLPAKSYFNPELLHNGKPQKYSGYCMEVFTGEAIAFIRQGGDKPFFVYLPANLIHEPLVAPPALQAGYKGLGGNLPPLYGMTESTDASFGRLRAALRERGIEENTLLIFASDNGPQIRTVPEIERAAGLHGMKGTIYEGGIRTPCLMRWPAGFPGGTRVEEHAAHFDILPTILDACGVAAPPDLKLDGRSLLPLLRNPQSAWPDRTIFMQFDSNGPPTRELAFAAIGSRWKLVQPCGADKTLRGLAAQYARIAAAERRGKRGIGGNTPRFELYDLASDPGETRDLAAQNPAVVAELRKQYNAWFDDVRSHAKWQQGTGTEHGEQ